MKARHLAWAIGCATVIAAAPAWAEFKYTFSSGYSNCLGNNVSSNCNFGNTRTPSSVTGGPGVAPTVSAQAWSNTAGSGSGDLETAYLPTWGSNGLGVQNRDMANLPGPVPTNPPPGDGGDAVEGSSPEHAMDNNERYDSILFSFGGGLGFKLTGVEIGYRNTDSDIFVLAGNAPLTNGSGFNYNDLTSNGWTLIGNYSNLSTNTKQAVNAGGVVANYWLVGTGCYTGSGSGVSICSGDYKKDYVKLLAVYGEPGRDHKAPEPGSAALLMGALAGLWRIRRRKG